MHDTTYRRSQLWLLAILAATAACTGFCFPALSCNRGRVARTFASSHIRSVLAEPVSSPDADDDARSTSAEAADARPTSCKKVVLTDERGGTSRVSRSGSSIWRSVVPPVWRSGAGYDKTVQWAVDDDPHQVAAELLSLDEQRIRSPTQKDAERTEYLVSALEPFRSHCLTHLRGVRGFKARIVSSRGPSGTKCPQWHVDHVPVRWIQSLVGKGCEYIVPSPQQDGINWPLINRRDHGDDDDNEVRTSQEDRNARLVDTSVAAIVQAQESEAMLLVGNRWNDCSKAGISQPHSLLHPVVHKSPAPIPKWEGRVLLTQDVLVEDGDSTTG